MDTLKVYMSLEEGDISKENFRNHEGGNLLFRPLALTQFISAILEYRKRKNTDLCTAMNKLSKIEMQIEKRPWKNILWLDNVKRINGRVSKKEIFRLMMYMADEQLLNEKEKQQLVNYIAASRDIDTTEEILEEMKKYVVKDEMADVKKE